MRVLDLFSGIGGFSLGLERAGMETVAFCEVDAFCRQVLAKHWPNVRIHDDVRTLDGNEYRGTVDVVCGGFPCQPFSVAGKRAGKDDDRHLWPEMLRIIREVQPRYVIGENVAGFVNMELDNCLSDLEAIGYSCGAFVIPACAVDAQHRRDRVWILANANSTFKQGRGLPGGVHAQDADPNSGSTDSGRPAPCKWKPEPGVGRVVNGVPRRMDRLKSLGNAVVPQVVEQIGLAIMGEQ